MRSRHLSALTATIVVAVAASSGPGCSDADTLPGTGSTASSTSSSTGAAGGAGEGGHVAAGGAGGVAGAGGSSPTLLSRGTETVSAGERSASASYRMVFTLGQPTQNQGAATSPNYRLQGGLQGANGSLP